jgi:hypothetical protein
MGEEQALGAWTDLLGKLVSMVGTEVEVVVSGADQAPPGFVSFEGILASQRDLAGASPALEVLSLYFGRTAMRLHPDHFQSARWSAAPGSRHLTIEMGNASIAMRARE